MMLMTTKNVEQKNTIIKHKKPSPLFILFNIHTNMQHSLIHIPPSLYFFPGRHDETLQRRQHSEQPTPHERTQPHAQPPFERAAPQTQPQPQPATAQPAAAAAAAAAQLPQLATSRQHQRGQQQPHQHDPQQQLGKQRAQPLAAATDPEPTDRVLSARRLFGHNQCGPAQHKTATGGFVFVLFAVNLLIRSRCLLIFPVIYINYVRVKIVLFLTYKYELT